MKPFCLLQCLFLLAQMRVRRLDISHYYRMSVFILIIRVKLYFSNLTSAPPKSAPYWYDFATDEQNNV